MCSRGRPLSGAAHPPWQFTVWHPQRQSRTPQGACQARRAGNKALRRGALEVCPVESHVIATSSRVIGLRQLFLTTTQFNIWASANQPRSRPSPTPKHDSLLRDIKDGFGLGWCLPGFAFVRKSHSRGGCATRGSRRLKCIRKREV